MKKILILTGIIAIFATGLHFHHNSQMDVPENNVETKILQPIEEKIADAASVITEVKDDIINSENNLIIETPYAFATAESAKTGAVFLTVKNSSNQANSLIEAKSDIAEIVELHQNLIDPDDGKMMMRKVKKIDLEPNGQAVLEPTGYHVMLINLNQQLVKDETFSLTLVFENDEEIEQDVMIVTPGMKPKEN